jgi:hypothetical protein
VSHQHPDVVTFLTGSADEVDALRRRRPFFVLGLEHDDVPVYPAPGWPSITGAQARAVLEEDP